MTWPTPPNLYYILAGLIAIPAVPYISFLLLLYHRTTLVPSHLPWTGLQDRRLFPQTRALLREWSAARKPLDEGYKKYSKNGLPFVLPALHWPDVALPPNLNGWLISQPDSVLSTVKTQDDLLTLEFFGHGPDMRAVHDFSVVTRDLTRQMQHLLPAMLEELGDAFAAEFGKGEAGEEGWREVGLYDAVEVATRRGVNRVFIGLPLCRDEGVMGRLYAAGICFSLCGALLRTLVPASLRRYVYRIVGAPFLYQRWRLNRALLPTITQRMDALRSSEKAERPTDALQWILSSAYNPSTNTFALSPADVAGKTLLLNIFALFTTSITAGTVLYDILTHNPQTPSSSNPSNADLLAQLREEATTILPQLASNPQAIRQTPQLDSVLRETLRFNPMFGRAIQREVMPPAGITTPDGLHLPRGTHVCATISAMQRDPTLRSSLPHADEYRPLRFYDPNAGQKQAGAVQISEGYLSFSLGKHACPGRFFAVQTIKVMLAWLLVHYEFEVRLPEGTTEVPWLEVGEARMPPQGKEGKVKVRRRKEGGEGKGEKGDGDDDEAW